MREAIEQVQSGGVRELLRALTDEYNEELQPFIERAEDFDSKIQALMTGIALHPPARQEFEEGLDEFWGSGILPNQTQTLVIGAGIHGATYCLNCGQMDSTYMVSATRIGGAFAFPEGQAFFLNSRNRKGGEAVPGTAGALNFIPGGKVQPSLLGGGEYQSQDDLAFAIRASLAIDVPAERIKSRTEVTSIEQGSDSRYVVTFKSSFKFYCDRIVMATGLGRERPPLGEFAAKDSRVLTFLEFMKRMGTRTFPLKGLKTVAVVGAGDGGNTVVEALLGQGPSVGGSVTALDYVKRIDWYGQDSISKERFEACNRNRYSGIARNMPREVDPDYFFRVAPYPGRVLDCTPKVDAIRLRYRSSITGEVRYSKPYDLVVYCVGFENETNKLIKFLTRPQEVPVPDGCITVAKQYSGEEIYKVGPAANIPIEECELDSSKVLKRIPQNSIAVFRYAPRTERFAKL